MTRSDFMVMVTTVFPDAVVTEGDRGELVIRTGWQVDPLDENNVTFMDRDEDVSFTLDDDSVHALSDYAPETERGEVCEHGASVPHRMTHTYYGGVYDCPGPAARSSRSGQARLDDYGRGYL